jgi:hypothetical protein
MEKEGAGLIQMDRHSEPGPPRKTWGQAGSKPQLGHSLVKE